eukprot:TRINITY_DN1382_c0_g2_i3.p1 TRINITY_DN1382_c0_g2~~TRINITY_DN1382_c0_g2_i3.p1  ORF type:complete len:238 (+),score=67.68 TRINITY_DN1382_c0_g2_i3:130-843(+)
MIRRPPRSTLSSSSAASDVYKRQVSTQSTGGQAVGMVEPALQPAQCSTEVGGPTYSVPVTQCPSPWTAGGAPLSSSGVLPPPPSMACQAEAVTEAVTEAEAEAEAQALLDMSSLGQQGPQGEGTHAGLKFAYELLSLSFAAMAQLELATGELLWCNSRFAELSLTVGAGDPLAGLQVLCTAFLNCPAASRQASTKDIGATRLHSCSRVVGTQQDQVVLWVINQLPERPLKILSLIHI